MTASSAHAHNRQLLQDLIDMGGELVRLVFQQAKAQAAAAPEATAGLVATYDRIFHAVRRGILLAEKMDEPPPPDTQAGLRETARRQVLRKVEDIIEGRAPASRVETLRAELVERMEGADIDADIAHRRVEDVIANIVRDLGLANWHGDRWRRRTPADIAVLCARAAARPGLAPSRAAPAWPARPDRPP